MSFQWLTMRISEERDRRERESAILARLPEAMDTLFTSLSACVETYNQNLCAEARIQLVSGAIFVNAGELGVEVSVDQALPGFNVDRAGQKLEIVIGILPGDKLFYRDADKYLTMEELTKRVLDRALFPKLGE